MKDTRHNNFFFFCCNVFIMCQKLHHSLLHTSVGECSLACIYYNEVETSHTASQNPTKSSWDMQQCNISSAGKKKNNHSKEGEIMTLVLWHTASNRGESNKTIMISIIKVSNPSSSISVDCTDTPNISGSKEKLLVPSKRKGSQEPSSSTKTQPFFSLLQKKR